MIPAAFPIAVCHNQQPSGRARTQEGSGDGMLDQGSEAPFHQSSRDHEPPNLQKALSLAPPQDRCWI